MKEQGVYTEVRGSHQPTHTRTTQEDQQVKMGSQAGKGNTVRERIVAKRYTEEINDNDDIFASTPIFCVLRTLLVSALCNSWICLTAFLHAAAAAANPYMYPPAEFYNAFEQIYSMKAQQSHLRTEKQSKSMAKPPTGTRQCHA